MLKLFLDIFTNNVNKNDSVRDDSNHALELAAAALMFEISQADNNIQQEERQVIHMAIRSEFGLSEQEADTLMTSAKNEVDNAVSLYDFTRVLNKELSQAERKRILELLWKVAFADRIVDKYEEYFIRKIADLLYVSHKDYIKAKHRAADSIA